MNENAKVDIKNAEEPARKPGGNWREKKEECWSSKAKGHYDVIQTKHDNVGETDRRMDHAIRALAKDMYDYTYHPEIMKLLAPLKGTLDLIGTMEVKEVLRRYGQMDIIYLPVGSEEWFPDAIRISLKLGLTAPGVGMPVYEFLRWYKGGDKIPGSVLAEWTGVPRQEVFNIYSSLVSFFQEYINTAHGRTDL